jgi:hypothetical protein
MNTTALIIMVSVWVCVSALTVYFIVKTLKK